MQKVKPGTAPGPDEIHFKFISELPNQVLTHILDIFNAMWTSHQFPDVWRNCIVIPIPKPGKDPSDATNYRPIALTSVLCKLLERMVNERLLTHLDSNYLINKHQCGGRKNKSTIDHLVKLETIIRNAFVKKEHALAVSFDMEKAYDITWRYGILRDLSECNVRGNMLHFIKNFLDNRKFQVRVGDQLSTRYTQENGVPQGSVLSPTLFIVKMNKISPLLQASANLHSFMYMDDLLLVTTDHTFTDACNRMQQCINGVMESSQSNGFKFSLLKTKAVHFTDLPGQHVVNPLYLGAHEIKYENTMKFLGLVWDNKLTFWNHIDYIKNKSKKALDLLKTLSSVHWGSDQEVIMRVYRALIRS